jgi:hypothetical protein
LVPSFASLSASQGGHFQILRNNVRTKIGSKQIFEDNFYE